MSELIKPPLGAKPRLIWKEERMISLGETVGRYAEWLRYVPASAEQRRVILEQMIGYAGELAQTADIP